MGQERKRNALISSNQHVMQQQPADSSCLHAGSCCTSLHWMVTRCACQLFDLTKKTKIPNNSASDSNNTVKFLMWCELVGC
jgi:hypothetical protein